VLAALADLDEDRHVWPHLFAELTADFGTTIGGVLDIDRPGLAARTVAVWPEWAARIRVTGDENQAYPLVRHFGRRLDPLPRTLDDVLDECRWRTAGRYDRMRRAFGAAGHHLMMPLSRSSSAVRLFGIGRPDGNFTEAEQQHARRLQPVLAALDRHQEVIAAWRAGWAADPHDPERLVGDHGITPRELAVLSLFAEGLSVSAAGRRLGISPRTVAKHQENLQRKLATADRLTTVLRAQRLGLVPAGAARIRAGLDPLVHGGARRVAED
jgi:DNA-binding CsgD family transcriptional regulator